MKEKNIILTARIMSMIFTPFYLPMVGLMALFIFSYMSLLPMGYKLVMLAMVYLLTVVASLAAHPSLPALLRDGPPTNWARKERRIVPYIISIVCYFGCFFWMEYRNTPRVISIICSGSSGDTDGMCLHQYMVEDHAPIQQPSEVWQERLVSYSIAFSFNPMLVALPSCSCWQAW